jgi:hypothetical protein
MELLSRLILNNPASPCHTTGTNLPEPEKAILRLQLSHKRDNAQWYLEARTVSRKGCPVQAWKCFRVGGQAAVSREKNNKINRLFYLPFGKRFTLRAFACLASMHEKAPLSFLYDDRMTTARKMSRF